MEAALDDRSSPAGSPRLDLAGGTRLAIEEGTEQQASPWAALRRVTAAVVVAALSYLILTWDRTPALRRIDRLYYLLPLLLATTALAAQELARRRALKSPSSDARQR